MIEPEVTVRLPIYEIEGVEIVSTPRPVMLVESHWSSSDRIVLMLGGHRYTFSARNLREACDRARKL